MYTVFIFLSVFSVKDIQVTLDKSLSMSFDTEMQVILNLMKLTMLVHFISVPVNTGVDDMLIWIT